MPLLVTFCKEYNYLILVSLEDKLFATIFQSSLSVFSLQNVPLLELYHNSHGSI